MNEIEIDARACHPDVAATAGRFTILRSTLPIERIQIEQDHGQIIVRVQTTVLDIGTGTPKPLQFGRAYPDDYMMVRPAEEAMGEMIQATLRYAMNHEIDETLFLDKKHFNNPHP